MIELVMTPVVVDTAPVSVRYAWTATQLVLSELTSKVRLSPLLVPKRNTETMLDSSTVAETD